MNSNRLNQWLTLGANIGVVIGIILLLIELNQTQGIARAETRNQISLGLTNLVSMIDLETAGALARANAGEEPSLAEQILISGWAESLLRYWENADYQYGVGMYDETEYSAHKVTIKSTTLDVFPGSVIPHYCQNKLGFSEHFRSIMDEFISQEMCAQ